MRPSSTLHHAVWMARAHPDKKVAYVSISEARSEAARQEAERLYGSVPENLKFINTEKRGR